MKKKGKVTRRELVRNSLAISGGLAGLLWDRTGLAAVCGLTPEQTEGPFYPESEPERDNDLTQLKKGAPVAEGRILYIQGTVSDSQCQPIADALVEIWQANKHGRYNHSGDNQNPAPLDPNFQYWGRMVTDSKGGFWFKTILPGEYPASNTWIRTPHIHYKVLKRGFQDLTTQQYFEGSALAEDKPEDKQLKNRLEELNRKDRILQSLSEADRKRVLTSLDYAKIRSTESLRCHFEVVMAKI